MINDEIDMGTLKIGRKMLPPEGSHVCHAFVLGPPVFTSLAELF
jgi:hypothetical protein